MLLLLLLAWKLTLWRVLRGRLSLGGLLMPARKCCLGCLGLGCELVVLLDGLLLVLGSLKLLVHNGHLLVLDGLLLVLGGQRLLRLVLERLLSLVVLLLLLRLLLLLESRLLG